MVINAFLVGIGLREVVINGLAHTPLGFVMFGNMMKKKIVIGLGDTPLPGKWFGLMISVFFFINLGLMILKMFFF